MPVSLENSNRTPAPVHGGVGQMLKDELYLDADSKEMNACLFAAIPAKSHCRHSVIPVSPSVPHALILLLFKFTNNSVCK